LPWTTKGICRKIFKKIDHIDYKIIAFEVKKRIFLYLAKYSQQAFESSWLKPFALSGVGIFYTMLEN
jgi:hypothetical protein